MYYGTIKDCDIANGPGVRVVLFVSGCTNNCPNCFQPETWNFTYGTEFTKETQKELIQMLSKGYVRGLTLLGGEPFEPANQRDLLTFLQKVREECPTKDIWAFSGSRLEELQGKIPNGEMVDDGDMRPSRADYVRTEVTDEMLSLLDVLVDGRFVERLKDITLEFRGSRNQRLIDMPRTLQEGKVVLWENTTSRRPM